MKSEEEVLEKLSALKRVKMSPHEDHEIRSAIGMKIDRVVPRTVKLRARRWKGYLATGGAVVAALGIAVAGIASLPGIDPRLGASSVVSTIKPNQIRTVSVDGTGIGGNSVSFLYNPYALNRGRALLTALQHGTVLPNKNVTWNVPNGGMSWLVLHLADGQSVRVQSITSISNGVTMWKNTFAVSIGQSKSIFIKDSSGSAEKFYTQLNTDSANSLNHRPAWLHNLSTSDVESISVDGNKTDTWFTRSFNMSPGDESEVLAALRSSTVLSSQFVDLNNTLAPGKWRTNSISLGFTLKDGATVHVSGPYSVVRNIKGLGAYPIFKVTYASTTKSNAVFIQDRSGQISTLWNQWHLSE